MGIHLRENVTTLSTVRPSWVETDAEMWWSQSIAFSQIVNTTSKNTNISHRAYTACRCLPASVVHWADTSGNWCIDPWRCTFPPAKMLQASLGLHLRLTASNSATRGSRNSFRGYWKANHHLQHLFGGHWVSPEHDIRVRLYTKHTRKVEAFRRRNRVGTRPAVEKF